MQCCSILHVLSKLPRTYPKMLLFQLLWHIMFHLFNHIIDDKRYNMQEMDKVAYGKDHIKIDKGKWNEEVNLQRIRSMRKWDVSVLDVCTLMREYRLRIEGSTFHGYLPYPL